MIFQVCNPSSREIADCGCVAATFFRLLVELGSFVRLIAYDDLEADVPKRQKVDPTLQKKGIEIPPE